MLRARLTQPPAGEAEGGLGLAGELFVPNGEERAVGQFDRGGIAQVAAGAVAGHDDRRCPGAAMIAADGRLIAQRRAAVP